MDNFVRMGQQFLQGQQGGASQQGGAPPQGADSGGAQSGGNQAMFGDVMNMFQNHQNGGQADGNVDENQLMSSFKKITGGGGGGGGGGDSQEVGEAAAISALQSHFGSGQQQQGGGMDGLLNKAMSIAGGSFDQSGQQGSKQDAMDHAKTTIMKLMIKHKVNSALGGGGGGPDLSSLMKMIS
ncbi:hypothetical protein MSPP1_003376 [Malassezia sp. CBS 17886]|nr:hypothetical protein MSPP1_003376 [Malassezia sp. CBS 17886]